MGHIVNWPKSLYMVLWVYLVFYGFLLKHWSKEPLFSILYPLLLLFLAIFLVNSMGAFVLLALGMLSWIRSSVCVQKPPGKQVVTEIILSLGGGIFVSVLTPTSAFTWGLGIWMFFLFQALYFVVIKNESGKKEKVESNAFEKARLQAEKILEEGIRTEIA